MRRLILAAGLALAAAALAGCAAPGTGGLTTTLTTALDEAQPSASPEQVEATVAEVIKTCVSRDTSAEGRGACMAMGVSGVVEAMAYRITRYDPQDAAAAIGYIQRLRAVISRFEAPDEIFLNTDLRLATLAIADVLGDVARTRVLRDVGLAATLDIRGGLDRARLVAEQLLLAEAMAADATAAMAAIRAGARTTAEIHAAALARIAMNERAIGVVNGVMP